MIRQMLNWNTDVVLAYNGIGLGEVQLLEPLILALTVLRHFAKPVLWDSFKNLLGWAFKQQNTNESNSKNRKRS